MKNKIIKAIVISLLCCFFIVGCSAVPSSTPGSYGEILDLNINLYDNASIQSVGNLDEILLEKFSLKKKYTSIENADIIFVGSDNSNIYE